MFIKQFIGSVGPINSVEDVHNDPHVKARELFGSFTPPEVGEFPAIRVPLRFKDTDNPEMGRPPLLGEHNEEVLSHRLGFSAPDIAALKGKRDLTAEAPV